MGALETNTTLIYGVHLRESANDGSDFSNAASDYRVLFLGEDGLLHVKDSAGTVTEPYTGSGSVATDAIWDAAGDLAVGTGADTAAKLAIGAAGGAVSRVNGAVAWNSGTSFPTAATGDRYWRTDLAGEFYYDGTRWLSTTLQSLEGGVLSLAASNNHVNGVGFDEAGPDYWLLDWEVACAAASTHDGTHNWSLRLFDVTANASGGAGTERATLNSNTVAAGADNYTGTKTAINALLDVSATPGLRIVFTKNNSPGNLNGQVRVTYRRIAT